MAMTAMPKPLRLAVAVGIAGLAALGTGNARAASAVVVDPDKRIFSANVEADVETAARLADQTCREMGGTACEVVVSCVTPGYGAVAVYEPGGAYFASCGAETRAQAEKEAITSCEVRFAQIAEGQCAIASRFDDKNPRPLADPGYFDGRWAEDCGDRSWYRFKFVSSWEFQVEQCESGEASCAPLKDVYSPAKQENVFVYPTTNHKLVKVDGDTLRWERLDYTDLQRCG